jgi:Ca2+-binding RTX toxin-like protein
MNRPSVLVAALLIACLVAVPNVASAAKKTQTLYGSDGSGGGMQNPPPGPANLYELNPNTGAVKRTIGSTGFSVTGLAIHPKSKKLYGVTGAQDPASPGSLIKVNKATGKGTLIGDEYEGDAGGAADITFTSDGTLYGWSENGDNLVRINLSTGAATDIGPGTSSAGSGISASPNDTLFLTPDGDDGDLFTVDRDDGTVTSVATLNGTLDTNINALAFDRGGSLFGSRVVVYSEPERDLIRIDTESGHITSLGDTIDNLDAIEFSEPYKPCKGAKANVLGTSKRDKLKGTQRKDLVAGERGNDRLNGRGGKDCVEGEGGKDKVSGGGGKDKVRGGGGKDRLKSADGAKDKVDCGSGKDTATVDPEDKVRRCEEVDVV